MSVIEKYYDEGPEIEWQRLERHKTEFAITLRTLVEYLPSPPARILDIGGGPGRYALALAQRGYQVTLVDLSKGNLAFARQKAREMNVEIVDYVHSNALNLSSIPPEAFDAALLLGPLYHLLQLEERQKALQEARRVLAPDGILFAAVITRYAPFRDLAKRIPEQLFAERAVLEELLATGIYRGHSSIGFTEAYFAHPSEIAPLMAGAGFTMLDLIACEGIVSRVEEGLNQLTGEQWQAWVDLNYRLGKDPTVQGAAEHLLYVGRK